MSDKKADGQSSSDSEELRCGQCLKSYKDPRLLTCLHSFCFTCIQDHVTKHKWKRSMLCPLCNKEMNIPKDGLSALTKDVYIKARQDTGKLKHDSECEICSEKVSAMCRCLDCEINLCKPCKAKHAPPGSDQVHNFLELVSQNHGKNNKPAVPKLAQNGFCNKHPEKELDIYCNKCKCAICESCKEQKHSAHPIEGVHNVAKVTRASLTHFLGAVREYLPDFETYVREVRKCQKEHDKDLQNAIKDVQSRCKFLQNEIEKISKHVIGELHERHKASSENFNKEAKTVINAYKSIATLATSADRILKIGTDLNILESAKKIQKRFMLVEDELPTMSIDKIETVGFVPGGLKADSLPKMFGQCTKGEIALPEIPVPWGIRAAKDYEMCSLASFKVQSAPDTIQAIAPVSDKEAWVTCRWGNKDIYLYTILGERKKKVTLDIQVDHMCMIPSGDLLVSSYEDKYIRKVNKEHVVGDFAMPHLYPGGMSITKRKEIYVCAVDSYTTRRSDHSDRCLMKLSEHGMTIDQIDEDGDFVLFGAPYRVTEAPNRDLVVTDREEGKLRVVRVDQEGCRKYIYTGPKEVKLKQPFNPLGLCCDRAGNMLVTDWGNHCVHLVDNEGEFKGFILSQRDGLFKPNAMAMDKSGNMWIGDGNATVRVYKYGKREY